MPTGDEMLLLREAIDLKKAGRHNAAGTLWGDLPEEFRRRVLSLANDTTKLPWVSGPGWVSCVSIYGDFTLSRVGKVDDQTLELPDLAAVIPELASGKSP